ncbi:DUF2680 domain-containing protein [Bacillus suaedaesalsae]|uniref:DUF2680 domain-containing protein n=1 Tax=Bacillus suaedaesalsae TaxID=2810349 RepID=A0ABS2DK98_9BACI|nr:DUF2680 domain-containing protein [Bacillus suaedaesalsae]MBM6618924.1 DUF2680 domain-containing protein [Bacillus suaedaesalsae]
MKKFMTIVSMMLVTLSITCSSAAANTDQQKQAPKVTLTAEQKEELAALHREVYEKKKEVVSKYVEYGVFTEEKGKFILEKMELHMKELEENNYIPKWDRHKHRHHK